MSDDRDVAMCEYEILPACDEYRFFAEGCASQTRDHFRDRGNEPVLYLCAALVTVPLRECSYPFSG